MTQPNSLDKSLTLLEKIFWLRRVIVLLAAFGLTVGITVPRLYKASQIKGWLPGATTTEETITQKWHQSPDLHPQSNDVHWVAWSKVSIQQEGSHRLRVTPERWEALDVGREIEVVWVWGDRTPYLRDGIVASPSNLAFDGIWLGAMGTVSAVVVIRMRQRKSQ